MLTKSMSEREIFYTDERNAQIVISLLKAHGIRKIVTSPGTTHMCFVGSVQNDPFFEVFSSVDERSAAYLACGLAEETGEPVVLSCTGATASRNYYSGLTEAYYRKLPIIAITSHQGTYKIGHLIEQNIDRRRLPNDIVKMSVEAVLAKDKNDEHFCEIEVNKAILESKRHGGGPVHINLFTTYSRNFTVKTLPPVQVINRVMPFDDFPTLPQERIAIYIGSHKRFSDSETKLLDDFCSSHDAVVFCDHTSGYCGRYKVEFALLSIQYNYQSPLLKVSLLIHMGEMTGDPTFRKLKPNEVWRVSPDGEIRDPWRKLSNVFEMQEDFFFSHYSGAGDKRQYLDECLKEKEFVGSQINDLPFSNFWVAQQFCKNLPDHSNIHFGINNSLRSWNCFELPDGVTSNCNVGGYGIDGNVSACVGASLSDPKKIYIAVVGDLAFFYDMNVLGNRYVGNNVRILVINNGLGFEMRSSYSPVAVLGDDSERFLAAAGHFGNKSKDVIRHYAEDLGYEYISATTKEEVLKEMDHFLTHEMTEKPMVFEIFVDHEDENEALKMISNVLVDKNFALKKLVKSVIGEKGVGVVKSFIEK